MRPLADMTWVDVEAESTTTLVVPLGSTEQHGPHLPLSTDTEIAVAVATRVAERLPGAVVAPPLAYGSSGEHQSFPGTLSVGQDALELLVVELVRSAGACFDRVVLVSAHGGNAAPLRRAVARLVSESRDVVAWLPRHDGDAHAGRVETSIMLALDPGRVDLGAAEPGNSSPLGVLMPALRRGGVRAVSENGILGDPAGASGAEGEELLEEAVEDVLRAVLER